MTETRASYDAKVAEKPQAITLWIDGVAVPALRARTVRLKNGHSHSYTPEKYANWKSLVAHQIMSQTTKRLDGPVMVCLTFRLPRPKSLPKKVEYPAKRPDIDNLVKGLMDSINLSGRIWKDDSQVVSLLAEKRYVIGRQEPGVSVMVAETALEYNTIGDIIGKWPGNETDSQIAEALEAIE